MHLYDKWYIHCTALQDMFLISKVVQYILCMYNTHYGLLKKKQTCIILHFSDIHTALNGLKASSAIHTSDVFRGNIMNHTLYLMDSQDVQFKQHESCFFPTENLLLYDAKKKAQKKYLASHSLQSFTILCRLEQQKTAVVVVVKKSFFPPDLFSNASVSIGSPFGIHAFGQKSVGNICADKKELPLFSPPMYLFLVCTIE